jgi:hypothetical protein
MLKAVPNRWLRWEFTIVDTETEIAHIDLHGARGVGYIYIGPQRYQVARDATFEGDFLLQCGDVIVARAQQPEAFVRSLTVQDHNKHYILEADSVFQRKFVLREGTQILGAVYPEHAFTRTTIIDLPPQMTLLVRVFLTAVVLLLWKQAGDDSMAY